MLHAHKKIIIYVYIFSLYLVQYLKITDFHYRSLSTKLLKEVHINYLYIHICSETLTIGEKFEIQILQKQIFHYVYILNFYYFTDQINIKVL